MGEWKMVELKWDKDLQIRMEDSIPLDIGMVNEINEKAMSNVHAIEFRVMKYLCTMMFAVSILTSCTYRPHEKRLAEFGKTEGVISHSFYRQLNDTIEFKRILTTSTKLVIQTGRIFHGDYSLTNQKFVDKQEVIYESAVVDSLITAFETLGFANKLIDDRDVVFIQIVPDSTMGDLDALRFLNFRHEIEGKIDERLKLKNLGEWCAGDMGAGGNMLFFVNNWEHAMETIMGILLEENLVDHVLIAKRIMTSANDWNYEVVYPVDYEGIFNQM